MAKKITRIVLTGGPAAGKTTLISRILKELKQEDGSYKRVSVKTGLSDGVNIEIKEGLSAGDVVRGPKIVSE